MQRRLLDTLQRLQRRAPSAARPTTANLAARIASYELAFKMQQHAPEAVDLDAGDRGDARRCTASTTRRRDDFGRQCLLARRLVERGVRFVQLYSGGAHNDDNWDAHGDLVKNHTYHAGAHRQADRRRCSRTSSGAACSTRRWSSGAASSAASRPPNTPRAPAAITTPTASPCGWPAAASRAASASARPTNSARPPSRTASTSRHLHATILHSAGPRPEPPDLLLRRPGSEAGRRRRGGADPPDHRVSAHNRAYVYANDRKFAGEQVSTS